MNKIPYSMFDAPPYPAADKLESLYHLGQAGAWDGKQVLRDLVERHGLPSLDPEVRDPLRDLFAVLLWGEMAAWNISAQISEQVDDLEAKLAATAQVHDEARHFYVMRDYLELLGPLPKALKPRTDEFLTAVLNADSMAKKLVGMQLMVEPMALTLFKLVRKANPSPVLGGLLALIEIDEARHVGLGTLYLPKVLRQMSLPAKMDLAVWQSRMYQRQFAMLEEMAPAFAALGISARQVFEAGRKKQLVALRALAAEAPIQGVELMLRGIDFLAEWKWPTAGRGRFDRLASGLRAARASKL